MDHRTCERVIRWRALPWWLTPSTSLVLAAGLLAMSGAAALASCSGISGGGSGYISGGGGCGSGPAIPSPSGSSGGGRTNYRGSGGNAFGGVSPGAVGAATGAAAAILNGLGNGSAPPSSPSQDSSPPQDNAACEQARRAEGIAAVDLMQGIMSASFAGRMDACRANKDLLNKYVDRLAKQETLIFSCDMHVTRNDGSVIDRGNFYAYRNNTIADQRKQIDDACHQSAKLWRECEDDLRSQSSDAARTCFVDLRELAAIEGDQPATERADAIAAWFAQHDQVEAQRAKEQAKVAAVNGCEARLAAKDLGGAKACFEGLLAGDVLGGDAVRMGRAHDVVAAITAIQNKLAAAADAAAAQQTYGANDPYGGGGQTRSPAPSTDVATGANAPSNPFDADRAGFDAPGGQLYSTIPEDGVYGTATYRDGTTAAPVPAR